jgi:hybrid cluster-associated redox disulfide protein
MTTTGIHRDLTVQELLDSWPSTREVFIRRRMACVGCDLAPFMTIGEAAASYGIAPDDLEQELHAALTQPVGASSSDIPFRTLLSEPRSQDNDL